MNKLLCIILILMSSLICIKANYQINIDLSESDYKVNDIQVTNEMMPGDEIIYYLDYINKQSDKLWLYLKIDSNNNELLKQLNIKILYKNRTLLNTDAQNLSVEQCLGSLYANQNDQLQIIITFDKNSGNAYTMKEANMLIQLKTLTEYDVQTGRESKIKAYVVLLCFSFIVICLSIEARF